MYVLKGRDLASLAPSREAGNQGSGGDASEGNFPFKCMRNVACRMPPRPHSHEVWGGRDGEACQPVSLKGVVGVGRRVGVTKKFREGGVGTNDHRYPPRSRPDMEP